MLLFTIQIYSLYLFFFFFKQKTAYEIGLGIPAEPLFRSLSFCVLLQYLGYDATPFNQILKQNAKREMRLRLGKVTVAEIGRASCRERVKIEEVGVSNKAKSVGAKSGVSETKIDDAIKRMY